MQRLDLRHPEAELRSYAVTRRGWEAWAPLALVLQKPRYSAVFSFPGRLD